VIEECRISTDESDEDAVKRYARSIVDAMIPDQVERLTTKIFALLEDYCE
jgi:hypothetical protein